MTLKELVFNLWKPRYERQGIQSEFKPIFARYIGIESTEYNDILKTLVTKAREDSEHCIVFDGDLPMQANFNLINSMKRDLATMDVTHLSTQDITMFPNAELNNIFLKALEYAVNLAIKNEHFSNDNVRNDFIIKMILNTFTYIQPLNMSLDYDGTYKCFYYGNIQQRDIYFLIMLYCMTFDVIYINPLKDEYWNVTDTDNLCKKNTYSMIQEIGTLNSRIEQGNIIQANESMTLHFEQQIESELYTNSGLYKPWQLRGFHVKQMLIKGNTIDIVHNWNEPAKVRNGFAVSNHEVSIPHFFFKIDGISSNMDEYKELTGTCKANDDCLVALSVNDLLEDHMTTDDTLQLSFYQLSDGTMDALKLKDAPFYPFHMYSAETQTFMIEKINELIKNPSILKTSQFTRNALVECVSTIFNINKKLQRMIDNFDFSSNIPKLVYFLENDNVIDKKSAIILAYLNNIGFDIVCFAPAGVSGLETYIDTNYISSVRLERMKYDMSYSDVKNIIKKSKGFFAKIFG